MSTNWKHNDLAHDLAEHLRKNTARICWEDMQLGPSGTCRPDVYAMAHSYSKFCPVVYEVKVSVSDFRADVTAGKYTKYFKYAGGVVFAVPEGLLKKNDIPEGCGLMIRKESGWHTLKGPTMRQLDNLPRDAWMKLLMDGVTRQVERTQIKSRVLQTYFVDQTLMKKHGAEIADLVCRAYHSREKLEREIIAQEQRLQSVQQEGAEELARQRKRRVEAEERLTDAQRDLAVALGLDPSAPMYVLTQTLWEATRRLTGDSEIQRLRRVLSNLEKTLADGMRLLPGEDAA
ncbi:MmcB family DNA repair protein [Klebsiella pneumoniae]|uniref:MmcB family DNA repair protein n=1 Tax=Klebsiella pneumoniae TaxID=573 RepID=UPI0028DF8401|nr:MmcB family DNA repair protein [Klebsiella variicola subsp. variicola]